jgi:Type II secretion system (T2SS), protein G
MILSQLDGRVGFSRAGRDGRVRTPGRLAIVAALLLALAACEREEKAVREDLPLARATKARTDAQTIATAVNTYRVTCGTLPESLEVLVTQSTVGDVPCGPVLGSIPTPPAGWSAYVYTRQGDSFTIASSGNGQTVSAP